MKSGIKILYAILHTTNIFINFVELKIKQQINENFGARRIKSATTAMAKYIVTYKCGHTAEVQLYGKHEERERKIKWYSTTNCPDCEAKEQREIAEKAGLPELTGSEKQVAWASKIRNNALETLNGHIEAYVAPQNRYIITEARDKWLTKETASTYWIDNRDDLGNICTIVKLIETSTKNQ